MTMAGQVTGIIEEEIRQFIAFQNEERGKRAAELIIAGIKLAFQNVQQLRESEDLVVLNKKLHIQNAEKERKAEALISANKKLASQNEEKDQRAQELSRVNEDLKKAEDAIRKLNEQLEAKVLERTMQLESAKKELEAFSYSVSHDLRAPLRAVHGYTQILQEDWGSLLGEEGNRVMNNIMSNAKKMGHLIDDLLTFSRLGRKELVKTNLPMFEMVRSLCDELKTEQHHREIEFRTHPLLPAEGDIGFIKQVWFHLISNAVKYTSLKEKAVIEIVCDVSANDLHYCVKDNGVGFDMRYANKLFGVFQRLHANEKFQGTGVGLAIVHRIITRHGGRVWAEGEINEGATFHFSLPHNKSL